MINYASGALVALSYPITLHTESEFDKCLSKILQHKDVEVVANDDSNDLCDDKNDLSKLNLNKLSYSSRSAGYDPYDLEYRMNHLEVVHLEELCCYSTFTPVEDGSKSADEISINKEYAIDRFVTNFDKYLLYLSKQLFGDSHNTKNAGFWQNICII